MSAQLLALRTAAPLELVASLTRERVNAIDPALQVMSVEPFTTMLDGPLARPRCQRVSSRLRRRRGAAGDDRLYAVMAAYVRQRGREIGIRVALGASASNVHGLVLGHAPWLTGVGVVIGLAGAAGAARVVRGFLADVQPLDLRVLLGAALLLSAAAAIAMLRE